jgi:hypothetical protein
MTPSISGLDSRKRRGVSPLNARISVERSRRANVRTRGIRPGLARASGGVDPTGQAHVYNVCLFSSQIWETDRGFGERVIQST